MIQPTGNIATEMTAPIKRPSYHLSYIGNDRMAGSVPKWDKSTPLNAGANPIEQSAERLATKEPTSSSNPFSFSDLLDMMNPLQHIPIVGHMYRKITGDEIKPIGQVIGGAVFGGAIGAGAGLVNVIAQAEIGKTTTQTAFTESGKPTATAEHKQHNPPQTRARSAYND